MVDLKKRFFCIWGDDFNRHQLAVENIKSKSLPSSDSAVNVLTIYSKQIQLKDFQEKVFTVSFSGNKLLIIKNCDELSASIKDFIVDNREKIADSNYVIFETEKSLSPDGRKKTVDKFLVFLTRDCFVIKAENFLKDLTVEDFSRAIRKNDFVYSLYVLEKLFEKGNQRELGPQLLGIMGSAFSYISNPVKKEKYLNYVFEADRMMKEKGLASRLAIEVLIAKILQG